MTSYFMPRLHFSENRCFLSAFFCRMRTACRERTALKIFGSDRLCSAASVFYIKFIKRLIRHIPEKHFKMIRYGGLYARHREIDKNLHLAISKAKRHTLRDFNKWRTAILSSFGYDPLKCPDCKHEMLFLELYFNHKRVSLEEMYEKIMSKARRRWSSA